MITERPRVLLSAYACEPGKGSEPEVGWQWSRHLAQLCDVTVLTRANNRPLIESSVEIREDRAIPRFIYHDLRPEWLVLKRLFKCHALYYHAWQHSVERLIAERSKLEAYDVLHHITFAGLRCKPAVVGHGVPSIWGPVGGLESVPIQLLPWWDARELVAEGTRNLSNVWLRNSRWLQSAAQEATLVLASTRETHDVLQQMGACTRLLPTIGYHVGRVCDVAKTNRTHLEVVFAGRLVWWKGVELALRAIAAVSPAAKLTFIGAGPYEQRARRLTRRLHLENVVAFRGPMARADLLEEYRHFDVMLYPSLHDSGSFTVLEAMACELPVVCLDAGGPGLAVDHGCGAKVVMRTWNQVISDLSSALRLYLDKRELIVMHGKAARKRVADAYSWGQKAEAMVEYYREVQLK